MHKLPQWMDIIRPLDDRRQIALPGNARQTIDFCVEHFFCAANRAIDKHGYFAVALSGGSTPKAIFEVLALPENRDRADWSRFLVFWGDERCVSADDQESNYRMAMEAGWSLLPVPPNNIFRMEAEKDLYESAGKYEALILSKIPQRHFDLIMLGVGDDGHTASLFPHTKALHTDNKLVAANHVPQKDCWRMTLTFKCINASNNIVVYALGAGKKRIVSDVLRGPCQPDEYPSQQVGTITHQALWVLDDTAAVLLKEVL